MVGRKLLRSSNLALAVCIALALLLRLAPLGLYVTPDEPAWVYRAILFEQALQARDWAGAPITGHPGVTTMWLGAAGVAAQQALHPQQSSAHLDWIGRLAWLAPENGVAFRHLAYFLSPARVAVVLTTTLGLLAAYWLAARLLGRRTALVATGLLAFDPFLVGHSALLHTDALLATFSLLALLAALNGLRAARPARWWGLSGLCAGLALLTKTPAVVLVLFLLLLLALSPLLLPRRHQLRHLLASGLLFGLAAAAVVVFAVPPF